MRQLEEDDNKKSLRSKREGKAGWEGEKLGEMAIVLESSAVFGV